MGFTEVQGLGFIWGLKGSRVQGLGFRALPGLVNHPFLVRSKNQQLEAREASSFSVLQSFS